jgi:hypothetical protein
MTCFSSAAVTHLPLRFDANTLDAKALKRRKAFSLSLAEQLQVRLRSHLDAVANPRCFATRATFPQRKM